MNQFTLTIHLQADDLSMLEPLARHLGHIEVAIDHPTSAVTDYPPERQPHPVVVAADEALHEPKPRPLNSSRAKAEREAERKRKEREIQRVLSPKVIAAVACPMCSSKVGQPCRGPSGTEFGFTGHTHIARRREYGLTS